MVHTTHNISTDTALNIVADSRCRSILTRLIESESNVVAVEELVRQIVPENPPPGQVGSMVSERPIIGLHHSYLPKMEDAGLVEYDDRSETICYYPNDRVEKLHQFVTTELE